LENGKSIPRLVDVRALLECYRDLQVDAVSVEINDLVEGLSKIGRTESWFASYRDVFNEDTIYDIKRFVEFENDAKVVRTFESDLVPGLLQTRGYVRSLIDQGASKWPPRRRYRMLEFRLARQRVLRGNGGPLLLDCVIGEAALRHAVGPPDVMREQVEAILRVVDGGVEGVSAQVCPISLGIPEVLRGPFLVMEFSDPNELGLVYLEGAESSQFLQSQDAVERYNRRFDDLKRAALDQAESRLLLETILRELGG
jgi:hypothetical protein